MRIKIPNLNETEMVIENKKSIVLIGSNGSGKTRMSVWIATNNSDIPTHRISAQKSLNMPVTSSPTDMNIAEEKLYYGITNNDKNWLKVHGKNNYRWNNKPETHLLNDFTELMEYLMTENYQKSIEYREQHMGGHSSFKNETKLEKTREIWEDVIVHRKMKISPGKIEVSSTTYECGEQSASVVAQEGEPTPEETHKIETLYNGSEMSDGERAIFYFIGEILCTQENSLIIIDEPENHLHKSILVRLWDAIEIARPDCMFLYITHSLEFASSRIDTQIVWVKNMVNSSIWEYELIDSESVYSADNLLLEIIGSRQKILLVEGRPEKSTDKKLYTKIFPEYNVLPLESCHAVIQATKAYNSITDIHYSAVKGIIDRDRRSDEEIEANKATNLFAPAVAEIENLFLLPDVIRIICMKQNKQDSCEQILASVKEKTLDYLQINLEQQALLFTRQRCQNDIFKQVNKKADNLDEYKSNLAAISTISNTDEIYTATKMALQKIIDDSDFLAALKVINNKGLLPHTKLSDAFGWRRQYYIDYVLDLLGTNDATANSLRETFKAYVQID